MCTYLPSVMMWVSEGLLNSELSPQIVAFVCFQNHCIANYFSNLIFQGLTVLEPDPIGCSTKCLRSAFSVLLFVCLFFFGTFHCFVSVILKTGFGLSGVLSRLSFVGISV